MGGRKMLELRLAASATPETVARAVSALAEVINLSFPERAEQMTTVVENRAARVILKSWGPRATEGLEAIAAFIENPSAEGFDFDVRAVASTLVEYCRREMPNEPSFWRPHGRKPMRLVTHDFVTHLVAAAKSHRALAASPSVVRGSTSLVARVLRVGSARDGGSLTAKLAVTGRGTVDFDVDERALGALCAAMVSKSPVKVKLNASWCRDSEGDLRMIDRGTSVVGVQDAVATTGPMLVKMLGGDPLIAIDDYRAAFPDEER